MQWMPSRISICVQNKKVQSCGTAKVADFVEKYYKDCCKSLMFWVLNILMILRKFCCFLDPLILGLKKAIIVL